MLSVLRIMRAAFGVVLALALSSGCGRWHPAKTYEVTSQVEAHDRYAAVLEVADAEKYTIVSQDPAALKLRLASKTNGKSFIDVEVATSAVKLSAAGSLVRDGKVHRALDKELQTLEKGIAARLGPAPAASESGPLLTVEPTGLPEAWTEPASDPAVWGGGNFTCLPVRVPPEHKASLVLKLSTGENADVELSLAYAPELCRSPEKCKVSGGCPALGIGDSERVNKLATRVKKGEIAGQATLLDGAASVARIDLARHGSIAEAMSEMKK